MVIKKLSMNLKSPVCFMPHETPVLDSVVSFCIYEREYRLKSDLRTPTGKEIKEDVINQNYLNFHRHETGFFMTSRMFWNIGIESLDSWKKRWCRTQDEIVDFHGAKRRINTGSGPYKHYNIPLVIFSIPRVWFYFVGKGDRVRDLIYNYLPGIGKKTAIGFGWIDRDSITVEEAPEEEKKFIYCRPVPPEFIQDYGGKIDKSLSIKESYGAYKSPYWLPRNQQKIFLIGY